MTEYIEREAAQKVICDYCNCEQLCDKNADCYVAEALKAIPAADVVPVRHGRWISDSSTRRGMAVRLDTDGCPADTCHCSECGDWLTASDEYPTRGRYCPNCGARMDGDGDV